MNTSATKDQKLSNSDPVFFAAVKNPVEALAAKVKQVASERDDNAVMAVFDRLFSDEEVSKLFHYLDDGIRSTGTIAYWITILQVYITDTIHLGQVVDTEKTFELWSASQRYIADKILAKKNKLSENVKKNSDCSKKTVSDTVSDIVLDTFGHSDTVSDIDKSMSYSENAEKAPTVMSNNNVIFTGKSAIVENNTEKELGNFPKKMVIDMASRIIERRKRYTKKFKLYSITKTDFTRIVKPALFATGWLIQSPVAVNNGGGSIIRWINEDEIDLKTILERNKNPIKDVIDTNNVEQIVINNSDSNAEPDTVEVVHTISPDQAMAKPTTLDNNYQEAIYLLTEEPMDLGWKALSISGSVLLGITGTIAYFKPNWVDYLNAGLLGLGASYLLSYAIAKQGNYNLTNGVKWTEVLDHLAPMPTDDYQGETYTVAHKTTIKKKQPVIEIEPEADEPAITIDTLPISNVIKSTIPVTAPTITAMDTMIHRPSLGAKPTIDLSLDEMTRRLDNFFANNERTAGIVSVEESIHGVSHNIFILAIDEEKIFNPSYLYGLNDQFRVLLKAKTCKIWLPNGDYRIQVKVGRYVVSPVLYETIASTPTTARLPVFIGLDNDNAQPIIIDPANPSLGIPHILVAGSTGKGKTSWLHSMLAYLVTHTSATDTAIFLADVEKKGAELSVWNNAKHMGMPVITSDGQLNRFLDKLEAEKEVRFKAGIATAAQLKTVKNVTLTADCLSGNKGQVISEFKNLFVILDEFGNMMLNNTIKDFEDRITILAQAVRGCGINLMLITQRTPAEIVSMNIKGCMSVRMSFHLPTGADTKTVFGDQQSGAHTLHDPGLFVLAMNGSFLYGKSPLITQEQVKAIVEKVSSC